MIAPPIASAGWSTIDDLGNTTPAGHGSAPDSAASNGGPVASGLVYQSEAGWTIPTSGGSCNWTVTGQLVVRNPTVDGLADGDPVVGVKVKVSGKANPGWFSEWETVTTDANGEFTVSTTDPGCDPRTVKVEARFESDDSDLYVTGPSSHNWYQLHETDSIGPSTIDLNVEPFGGETGEQSTTQARTDAQTWIVYRKAIDRLAEIGQPFLNPTTVHNPATVAPNGSWADPILHAIHISPGNTSSLDNWLHEAAHLWAYPREIGEGCLTWAAIEDGSTHDQVEAPCVAFNEGFADFFSNKLEQDMNTAGLISSTESPSVDGTFDTTTPINRAELKSHGLVSLSSVATNELGWDQVFRVLTSADITRQLFGPGFGNGGPVSTYVGPSCKRGEPVGLGDLADALRVIGYAGDQLDLQDSDDPTVADLFGRAADRLAGFDDIDAIAYQNAVDPNLVSEPHDAYGC